MDDPLGAAREVEELRRDVAEFRLALEVVPGLAVHLGRAGVDLALGVDVELDRAAGGAPVDDLDARELDDAVALLRVEAGGFGVEDDLAHSGFDSGGTAPVYRTRRGDRPARSIGR